MGLLYLGRQVKAREVLDFLPTSWTWLRGWKKRLFGRNDLRGTCQHDDRAEIPTAAASETAVLTAFTLKERRLLLELAKRSVEAAVNGGSLPTACPQHTPDKLLQPKGCFITLRKGGKLRGCIGQIFPRSALCEAIIHNARNAATNDPRFPPIQLDELGRIEIEISILTEPQSLRFNSAEELLEKLNPHTDGVVLQIGERSVTFLPQVWANFPNKIAFMESLSKKANCEPDAWRNPGTSVSVYRTESFHNAP